MKYLATTKAVAVEKPFQKFAKDFMAGILVLALIGATAAWRSQAAHSEMLEDSIDELMSAGMALELK